MEQATGGLQLGNGSLLASAVESTIQREASAQMKSKSVRMLVASVWNESRDPFLGGFWWVVTVVRVVFYCVEYYVWNVVEVGANG